MLKKNFYLFFLILGFLSINYCMKAMQGEDKKGSKRRIINEQQGDESLRLADSLKFLAASRYLETLEDRGGDIFNILSILDNENENYILPEELKYYCKSLIIDKHFALLEQVKEREYHNLPVIKEDLDNYRQLLDTMLKESYPDFNLILSILDNHFRLVLKYYDDQHEDNRFQDYDGIMLIDINVLLKLLIEKNVSFNAIVSNQERDSIDKIICSAFNTKAFYEDEFDKNNADLRRLLVKVNLLPPLDYMTSEGYCFFILLARGNLEIDLFHVIVNKEKDKCYDWHFLFSRHENDDGNTALHYMAEDGDKEKFIAILDLIKEKCLPLNLFINIQNHIGLTPLMAAANECRFEMVKLLTDYSNINAIKMINKQSVRSLKFLAALNCIGALNREVSSVGQISQELQRYCDIIVFINKHCAFLEQLKGDKYNCLGFTQENLAKYKSLLYEIFDTQCIDFNLVCRACTNYFNAIIRGDLKTIIRKDKNNACNAITIALEDINILLKALIKLSYVGDIAFDTMEQTVLKRIINSIFLYKDYRNAYGNLRYLLASYNLFPKLDCMNINGTNFLEHLVSSDIDIKLFNLIINKEKDKAYNWEELFSITDEDNKIILHHAVLGESKDKVEAILNLIQEKNLA